MILTGSLKILDFNTNFVFFDPWRELPSFSDVVEITILLQLPLVPHKRLFPIGFVVAVELLRMKTVNVTERIADWILSVQFTLQDTQ